MKKAYAVSIMLIGSSCYKAISNYSLNRNEIEKILERFVKLELIDSEIMRHLYHDVKITEHVVHLIDGQACVIK